MVYLIRKMDVWLIFNLASTITRRSFLARSLSNFLAPRALHWSLWKPLLLLTFPVCPISHHPVMLAEPCSACRTSAPAFSADTIALAVHQVAQARLFSWKWWVCSIRVLRGGKVRCLSFRKCWSWLRLSHTFI